MSNLEITYIDHVFVDGCALDEKRGAHIGLVRITIKTAHTDAPLTKKLKETFTPTTTSQPAEFSPSPKQGHRSMHAEYCAAARGIASTAPEVPVLHLYVDKEDVAEFIESPEKREERLSRARRSAKRNYQIPTLKILKDAIEGFPGKIVVHICNDKETTTDPAIRKLMNLAHQAALESAKAEQPLPPLSPEDIARLLGPNEP